MPLDESAIEEGWKLKSYSHADKLGYPVSPRSVGRLVTHTCNAGSGVKHLEF